METESLDLPAVKSRADLVAFLRSRAAEEEERDDVYEPDAVASYWQALADRLEAADAPDAPSWAFVAQMLESAWFE